MRSMGELQRLEWTHPVHGQVAEVACNGHRTEVLGALSTLGIGSSGESTDALACVRCAYGSAPTRTWIKSLSAGALPPAVDW